MARGGAILFDLGDTLIHFGDVDKRALFEQGAWHTYQIWAARQKRMPDYRRYYRHQWFAVRWAYFKSLVLRRELDAMRLIRRACDNLRLMAPEAFFRELAWQWYRPLAEVATVEPDTADVLQSLSEAGYDLAIVSNTFVPGFVIDRHLEQLDLIRFFPVRVYSCDVRYRKPDPRIFQIALERLGAAAAESVYIGDLPQADIAGASRAGLRAIWKKNGQQIASEERPDAAAVIGRLNELPPLIDRLFDRPAPHSAA